MSPINAPLKAKPFTLDSSGLAGFFGGSEAISAMATVHIYEGRKWLGWYNSPGSYTVAKRYGRLAQGRVWNGLFPGVNVDPATLFSLDGNTGPGFIACHAGVKMPETGHLGYLVLKKCHSLQPSQVEGRQTLTHSVTIADLKYAPEEEVDLASPRTSINTLMALIPILFSIAACLVCGLISDWYCLSMTLLGILSSGISCFVIGSGTFKFRHPIPAACSPRGDGLLYAGSEFVALCGKEEAVNSITRGRFLLRFKGEPEFRAIGISAMLLTTQFLLQLLLIPQGTLFGQMLFLSSLAVSWAYNCYLSSLDRDIIQAEILTSKVLHNPEMKRYQLGTRTSAVVFIVLALRPSEPIEMFDTLLPDNPTWQLWKRIVSEKVKRREPFVFHDGDYEGVVEGQRMLLQTLFQDASDAYEGHLRHLK